MYIAFLSFLTQTSLGVILNSVNFELPPIIYSELALDFLAVEVMLRVEELVIPHT